MYFRQRSRSACVPSGHSLYAAAPPRALSRGCCELPRLTATSPFGLCPCRFLHLLGRNPLCGRSGLSLSEEESARVPPASPGKSPGLGGPSATIAWPLLVLPASAAAAAETDRPWCFPEELQSRAEAGTQRVVTSRG